MLLFLQTHSLLPKKGKIVTVWKTCVPLGLYLHVCFVFDRVHLFQLNGSQAEGQAVCVRPQLVCSL